jgi:hypothetical protein
MSVREGCSYIKSQPVLSSRLSVEPNVVFRIGKRLYISYGHSIGIDVLNATASDQDTRETQIVLRDHGVKIPESAYNTCLLVDGRQEFPHAVRTNGRYPLLWYNAVNGEYDAYTEWRSPATAPFHTALCMIRSDQRDRRILRRVYSARAGIGASYARRPIINNEGVVDGYHDSLAILNFDIREVRGREVLTIGRLRRSEEIALQDYRSPWNQIFDRVDAQRNFRLQRVVQAAVEGFTRTCEVTRSDFEERRTFLVNQHERMKQDGVSFRKMIDRLDDWKKALGSVEEPWQLALVVEMYCTEMFNADKLVWDPESQRIARMIDQFPEVERRPVLHEMARKYGLVHA